VYGRVVDVDADAGRHHDLLPLHEDVEVRVDVEEHELVRLRRQPGLARELHGVRRRGPDGRRREGSQ
jgi:hypothetical protein